MKDIKETIERIEIEGCDIPHAVSGNGLSGPMMINNCALRSLIKGVYFDGFEYDPDPPINIQETLEDLGQWDPDTEWWVATKMIGEARDQNPYHVHLILWDA